MFGYVPEMMVAFMLHLVAIFFFSVFLTNLANENKIDKLEKMINRLCIVIYLGMCGKMAKIFAKDFQDLMNNKKIDEAASGY